VALQLHEYKKNLGVAMISKCSGHRINNAIKTIKLTLLVILIFPVASSGAVIFIDDYDAPGDTGWTCLGNVRTGYTGKAACSDPLSYEGVAHYLGEISPGGRSGNSLKLWRKNGIWTGYGGYLDKDFSLQEFNNNYKELFIRWYVKIPPEWDADLGGANTHKLNRLYIGALAGAKTAEWYMDVKGHTFKAGKFSFYNTATVDVHYTEKTVTELGVNDGQWHSLEWHVKLNSETGSTDGGFTFYVDGEEVKIRDKRVGEYPGTPVYGIWNMDMGAATNHYFTSTLPPAIGNLSGGSWNFPTDGWYAFEFDDYVVSTSYIGPDGDGAATPPHSPSIDYVEILNETWEQNNVNNWKYDYVAGDTRIDTNPIYAGNYAIKMGSSSPGSYAHFFGDHPQLSQPSDSVTDVTVEEYYYPSTGFKWPSSDLKLWIMNCFESWGAGYDLATGKSKPHTWAPYYMTISVDGSGKPFGQLTRADGLGGTGELWGYYPQNQGSSVSLVPGQWNKIKFRLKLNDPGKNNGVFQLWVNDVLKCNYSTMNFRGTYTSYGWNHLIMSMHANPSHPQIQWISRDNIRIMGGQPTAYPSPPSPPTGVKVEVDQ